MVRHMVSQYVPVYVLALGFMHYCFSVQKNTHTGVCTASVHVLEYVHVSKCSLPGMCVCVPVQEIANHMEKDTETYEVVQEAIDTMQRVAWHINDMKRKHEHAVRLQVRQTRTHDKHAHTGQTRTHRTNHAHLHCLSLFLYG